MASRADVLQAEIQLKTTKAKAIDIGVQRVQIEHAIALSLKDLALVSLAASPFTAAPCNSDQPAVSDF